MRPLPKLTMFLLALEAKTHVPTSQAIFIQLCDKQIETYIDYKLHKGDDVWPALAKAIEDSHLSIVVFSENYATSKWCLEELVKTLQCRKDQGQIVIPVFHTIDPSHVRKQIGTYGEAFAKHERELEDNEPNQHKVSRWKAALTEAANISGWDFCTHRDDSQLIKNIVNDVMQKLHLRYPRELEGLVGIDKNCRDIESILEKVRVLGICGMGGVGKTTIAKAMFAKHFPHYDSVCFLANIREQSTKLGLTYLRDKLLSNLLNEQIPTTNVVGSTFIKRRVRSKKVFIVLDDVDSFEQLEYLCGEHGDLGPDSKLIITTRYKHLLTGRADEIYKVKTWKYPQSLHLFSLNAFKKSHPQDGYEDLSAKAVHYAGGVPLALKILGSHLYSKSHEFWESTLSKLEKYPDEKILKVLQLSYYGLDKLEKDIFLDIAFFFKEDKEYVTRILNACGFHAASGIDNLVDKALITISHSNRIQMHDLLQEMGFEIAREECGSDLGRRSRLSDIEEVCDLLKNNKGTDATEGIILDLSQIEDLHLNADTFNMMTNLRFLRFHNPLGRRSGGVHHPRVLKTISDKLRYHEWNGYPLNSLPSNFCAKFLVEIHMPHSHIKELWQGMQDLVNLKGIDVSECKQLTKLPDLSRASKLEWVYLSGCESLRDLHSSVLSLDTLVTLILDGCKRLKSLKSKKHLRSLQMLSFHGCSNLKELSVSSNLIESLDLSQTRVKLLHSSIGRLRNLKWLNLEGLRLKNLPDELCSLTSLMELKISNCRLVINIQKLHILFDGLRSLKVLYLRDCCNLYELPDNISILSMLRELKLDGSSVERLPASLKHLQELEILSLEGCRKLQCLPELPPSIRELYADNCTSLVKVSNLKTFATQMKGKYQRQFSFKNCMKLDGHSLNCIMEGTVSAALHNVLVSKHDGFTPNSIYSIMVSMPGSRVPRQVTYRTTLSCINVEIHSRPKLLGFFFSVVLFSPSPTTKTETTGEGEISCACYSARGVKYGSTENAFTADFNSNHVFVWYNSIHGYKIPRKEGPVSFEFNVAGTHGRQIVIKECGVRLLYVSEFHSFLGKLELELDRKVAFRVKLGLELNLQQLYWKWQIDRRCLLALQKGLKLDASLNSQFESGRRAILTAIKKETQKSNGIVSNSQSVLRELELGFDKKVELGLKLALALDMEQLEEEMDYVRRVTLKFGELQVFEREAILRDILKEPQEESEELERKAILTETLKEAQKSNEFVSESQSFSGELELEEFDKKLMLGVSLGLALDMEQNKLKGKMIQRLLKALEDGSELEASLKSEFESRSRAILMAIEKETKNSHEFIFPPLSTGIWKNKTQGLKDIVSLFP